MQSFWLLHWFCAAVRRISRAKKDKDNKNDQSSVLKPSADVSTSDEITEEIMSDTQISEETEEGSEATESESDIIMEFKEEDIPKEEIKKYVKKDLTSLIIDPAYTTSDGEWHWLDEKHFSSSFSGKTATMTCDFVSVTDLCEDEGLAEKGFGAFRLDIYNWDENRFDYESGILKIHFDKIELVSPTNRISVPSYEKTYKLEMRTDIEEMGRNFTFIDITKVPGIDSIEELSQYKLNVRATVLEYKVKYKE